MSLSAVVSTPLVEISPVLMVGVFGIYALFIPRSMASRDAEMRSSSWWKAYLKTHFAPIVCSLAATAFVYLGFTAPPLRHGVQTPNVISQSAAMRRRTSEELKRPDMAVPNHFGAISRDAPVFCISLCESM